MKRQKLTADQKRLIKRIAGRVSGAVSRDGMTLDELAASSGVARSTIRETMSGTNNMRVATLQKIVRALGFGSLWAFLNGIEA